MKKVDAQVDQNRSLNETDHKCFMTIVMHGFRWGGGAGVKTSHPVENLKGIGFLSNTGPDPLNNYNATKSAFNVEPLSVRQRKAI